MPGQAGHIGVVTPALLAPLDLSTATTDDGRHRVPPCPVGTWSPLSRSAMACRVAPWQRSATIRSATAAGSVLARPIRSPRARLTARASVPLDAAELAGLAWKGFARFPSGTRKLDPGTVPPGLV
jgi:hypothetical protein